MAKVTWDKKPAIPKKQNAVKIGRPINSQDKLTKEVITILEDIIGLNDENKVNRLTSLFWSDSDIVDELNERIERTASKITKRTWRNWKAKCGDKEWLHKSQEHEQLLPILNKVKRLQKQYLGNKLLTDKNWTAAAWVFERKFRDEWARNNEISVKGSVKNEHVITAINIHPLIPEPTEEEQKRLKKEFDVIDIPPTKESEN